MKQLLSLVVIAGTVTIITFSSCAKEEPWSPSALISQSGYPPPAIQSSANFELVANNWVNSGGQMYINTFKGVIASANASGNRTVTVYLQENGTQTQISQRRITYMGNELWAINSQADVSIIYRCSTKLPFTSLNIRVQVN
jgi:hypothetical protein